MKRVSALICVMMMAVTMLAPAAFAANNESAGAADKSSFEVVSSSPEDGAKGVAVDNLSIKIYFSKDVQPKNNKVKKANKKQVKLQDSEGHKIPIEVYYSKDEEGLILVAADNFDTKDKNKRTKSDEKYTLTIKRNFQATDGTKLGQAKEISMTTLNQGRSTAIYMVLMVLMMVGMVFFVVRGTKKEENKKKEEREFKEGVNPYKEAKKSGKSVEEVVAKQSKKKQKKEEAIRRQKEAEAAIEAEIIEKIRKEQNKRVSAPRSITAAGSNLKLKVVNDEGKKVDAKEAQAQKGAGNGAGSGAGKGSSKGTTNPKGQSGKAKNKKGKKK